MKNLFILLLLLSSSTYADIFKCQLESGKTAYQSTPCLAAVKQETVQIQKPDPKKTAEAEAKLKTWKEDFATREAVRIQTEKELQVERDRKASVDALQKSAEYQRQQAYESRRQADALEQRPYLQYPYYSFPGYQSLPPYSSHAPDYQHHLHEKSFPHTLQLDFPDTKNREERDITKGLGNQGH